MIQSIKLSQIKSILDRINNNEDEWKALHMAVWSYSHNVQKQYLGKIKSRRCHALNISSGTSYVVCVDNEDDVKKVALGLPASVKGYHEFDPEKLHSILTSSDYHIVLNNLIIIFSLFEVFLKIIASEVYQESVDTGTKSGLRHFIKKDDFGVDPKDINEIILAKKTRDCYIHSDSRIDREWISLFGNARGIGSRRIRMSENDNLVDIIDIFKEVEVWQNMIVKVSNNIYKITNKK
jgi:hypothetical protein